MNSGKASFVVLCCVILVHFQVSESQISYGVRVLRLYPRVFRFNNGESVVYYRQLGRGQVDVYFNGTSVNYSLISCSVVLT